MSPWALACYDGDFSQFADILWANHLINKLRTYSVHSSVMKTIIVAALRYQISVNHTLTVFDFELYEVCVKYTVYLSA